MPEQRLQKIISQAGVTSRRKAEELILAGQVTVNGEVIMELGSKADLERDHIKVGGRLLRAPTHHTYIALNKPPGYVTTVSDPEGRKTVMECLRGVKERVFPVGRLDFHSEGLLLLTNDGEFAHRITAPAQHVLKTYVVKANGPLTEAQETQFREGIPMHGRKTSPAQIKLIKPGVNPWYEIKIAEGRQNQIRIMFKHCGHLVEKLRRVKIAFLELDQAPGRYRHLTTHEVERFQKLLKLDEASVQSAPPHDPALIAPSRQGGDSTFTRKKTSKRPKPPRRRPYTPPYNPARQSGTTSAETSTPSRDRKGAPYNPARKSGGSSQPDTAPPRRPYTPPYNPARQSGATSAETSTPRRDRNGAPYNPARKSGGSSQPDTAPPRRPYTPPYNPARKSGDSSQRDTSAPRRDRKGPPYNPARKSGDSSQRDTSTPRPPYNPARQSGDSSRPAKPSPPHRDRKGANNRPPRKRK